MSILIVGANSSMGAYFAEKLQAMRENAILFYHAKHDNISQLSYPRFACDITDPKSIEQAWNKIEMPVEKLVILSSLRASDFKPLRATEPEFWRRIIEVNLIGTGNVLRAALGKMDSNKTCRIVIIGSNVSRIGLPLGSAYAASKAGLTALCRSVAKECAPHILLNIVSPGPTETENNSFSEEYRNFRKNYFAEKLKDIPLQRVAYNEDVFNLVWFLLSEKNNYLTGEEIFLTGGAL